MVNEMKRGALVIRRPPGPCINHLNLHSEMKAEMKVHHLNRTVIFCNWIVWVIFYGALKSHQHFGWYLLSSIVVVDHRLSPGKAVVCRFVSL